MSTGAWIAVAVVLVVLLIAADRAVAAGWFDRRRPRPRPATREGPGVASGLLGDLVEVFQPSRHHVTDEQDRHALDIRQAPVEGPPDLDSGVVVLPPTPSERQHHRRPDGDRRSDPDPDRTATPRPPT
ncbi:hypothetical protein CELL_01566 [Cellulomonas sp. T2.31MG-18]|uniref:DUF6191 domain-containing protein n=1 Tax=Cellulomonas sp. T2.31MG-18 TaxID=3157619 RepID=UPI0035E7B2AD